MGVLVAAVGCGGTAFHASGDGPSPYLAEVFNVSRDGGPLPVAAAVSLTVLLDGAASGPGVVAWLRAQGLTGDWAPGEAWMIVSGPAARVDSVFGVDVHGFTTPDGRSFYGARQAPRVPDGLGGVASVSAISSFVPSDGRQAIPKGGMTPTDLSLAYDFKPLRDAGFDGSGETIVVWGLDGYRQASLDTFDQKFGLPPLQVTEDGGAHITPGNGSGYENEMDLEVVHMIAPGAKIVFWNDHSRSPADYLRSMDAAYSKYPGAIFSHSWGFCDQVFGPQNAQAMAQVFDKAVQLGEMQFVASGDEGGYDCLRNLRDWGVPPDMKYVSGVLPSSVPGAISVGGTRISLRSDSSWLAEVGWQHPDTTFGGGGGLSAYFAAPSWQVGPGVSNEYNPKHMRQYPDVSADADDVSGLAIYSVGQWGAGNGTSQAAPIWAGIGALFNAYVRKSTGKPLTWLQPMLYALAAGHPPYPPFHDVTVGGNLIYPATPGYDLATGLGTPDAWNLARDLVEYVRNGGHV